MQITNNEFLEKIFQKNQSCAFIMDRSISFLSTHRTASGNKRYASIDEFREKIPLTTYDDYREYIDRMAFDGEKNLLSSENIVYFSTSSGTTGKMKLLPVVPETMKKIGESTRFGTALIWRSFPPSSVPSPEQRTFSLQSGKKTELFQRSKDGTPIGPLSQSFLAFSSISRNRSLLSINSTLTLV